MIKQLVIRTLLFMGFATICLAQSTPKWKPETDKIWDPNKVLNTAQILALEKIVVTSTIQTKIVIFKDLSAESIGKTWDNAIKKAKNNSVDPNNFSPAGVVLSLILERYRLGEMNRGDEQSLVILVTTIRGDPKKRFVLSVSEPTHQKFREEEFNKAYLAFAQTISKQGDSKPARSEKIVEGLEASLPILFKMLR